METIWENCYKWITVELWDVSSNSWVLEPDYLHHIMTRTSLGIKMQILGLFSGWETIKKLKDVKKIREQKQWGWVQFITTLKALSDGMWHVRQTCTTYLSPINILFTSLSDIDLTPKFSAVFFPLNPHTPMLTSIIMPLTQHCLFFSSLFLFSAHPLSLWVNAGTLVFLCRTQDRRWDV